MGEKILVAYASRLGSTSGVAEHIAEKMRETGAVVDVRHVEDVTDLVPYRAVVLGSAIRHEKVLPEIIDFVKWHRDALSRMPVAYFVLCMTMRMDTDEHRQTVLQWLNPVVEQVHPIDVGLFAGALYYGTFGLVMRLVLRATGKPQGDFRDWASIDTWTTALLAKLQSEKVM